MTSRTSTHEALGFLAGAVAAALRHETDGFAAGTGVQGSVVSVEGRIDQGVIA